MVQHQLDVLDEADRFDVRCRLCQPVAVVSTCASSVSLSRTQKRCGLLINTSTTRDPGSRANQRRVAAHLESGHTSYRSSRGAK